VEGKLNGSEYWQVQLRGGLLDQSQSARLLHRPNECLLLGKNGDRWRGVQGQAGARNVFVRLLFSGGFPANGSVAV
jgi:hypothetical protein